MVLVLAGRRYPLQLEIDWNGHTEFVWANAIPECPMCHTVLQVTQPKRSGVQPSARVGWRITCAACPWSQELIDDPAHEATG